MFFQLGVSVIRLRILFVNTFLLVSVLVRISVMSPGPSSKESDYLYSLSNKGEYGQLVQYIANHERESVRYGAAGVLSESVHAFAQQRTPKAQQMLVQSVVTDPSDAVRGKVMRVLLEIDESTADTVITWLESNPDAVRNSSPYPLILTKWNSSQHVSLRYLAVVGFGRTSGKNSVTKLRTKLKEEDSIRVLCRAIEEAGEIGDESFVTPIQQHLRGDENDYYDAGAWSEYSQSAVQQQAVEALVEIGTNAAYEALVTSTRSSDTELKQYAIKEIGRFGLEDTVDVVVDQLDDEDDDLREDAAKGVITAFTESYFEDSDDVRRSALEAIVDDVSVNVSSEFASIIEESDAKTEKRNAAWVLGELDEVSSDAVDSLFDSLREGDAYLQNISMASLSKINENNNDFDVDAKLQRFRKSVSEDSDMYELCDVLEELMSNTAEEAKKNIVEYSYVSDPSDYPSS